MPGSTFLFGGICRFWDRSVQHSNRDMQVCVGFCDQVRAGIAPEGEIPEDWGKAVWMMPDGVVVVLRGPG